MGALAGEEAVMYYRPGNSGNTDDGSILGLAYAVSIRVPASHSDVSANRPRPVFVGYDHEEVAHLRADEEALLEARGRPKLGAKHVLAHGGWPGSHVHPYGRRSILPP